MTNGRIRVSYAHDEPTPPNLFTDHDWVRRNEQMLLDQYGEQCSVVYQQKVIGNGNTYETAVENAEHSLAPDAGVITPVVELLHHRHPFLRVRPGSVGRATNG